MRDVVCYKRLQYDITNFMQVGEFLKSFLKLPVFSAVFVLLNEERYKLQKAAA